MLPVINYSAWQKGTKYLCLGLTTFSLASTTRVDATHVCGHGSFLSLSPRLSFSAAQLIRPREEGDAIHTQVDLENAIGC